MSPVPAHFSTIWASSAVSIDFDLTFLAHFVLFTTFVLVMKPLAFDPLIRLFEERERRTEGARVDARAMDARAAELLGKYEAELARVRREAGAEREKLRLEAAQMEARILGEARIEAQKILDDGQKTLQAELVRLRGELDRGQGGLAKEIATRILGREVHS